MKTHDLITTAFANVFRSKTRTILTVLAIFVGAFTLTLTSGLGTGINRYIDDTVTAVGASDVLTVTRAAEGDSGMRGASGPREYDPEAISSDHPGPGGGGVVTALTQEDLDALAGIDGVLDVQPTRSLSPDFIQAGDGTPYVVNVGSLVSGQEIQLIAGQAPDDNADEAQLVLPVSYVEPLGFADESAAIGESVTLQISDALRTAHVLEATVVGVAEEGLASPTGASIVLNDTLSTALEEAQNTGLPADQENRYAEASVWYDAGATADETEALQDRLADAGFSAVTVSDQLGTFTTVIDGIVLVLNAFAVIALLAASFGIVNTLYMSVQERTREIGLMKAMGMGNGRVFGLFSLEATVIGLLGSVLGVGVAMVAGGVLSRVLSRTLLADLPGLTLIAFDAGAVGAVIALVVAIAFLAGTFPAARAARADPVNSLRYA
ncbi:MAG TPA: ABC transporter permease [Arachnia sp.]|nr:ABC transporter permease [Arachnia sp.]